jgi:hypothetical protein
MAARGSASRQVRQASNAGSDDEDAHPARPGNYSPRPATVAREGAAIDARWSLGNVRTNPAAEGQAVLFFLHGDVLLSA